MVLEFYTYLVLQGVLLALLMKSSGKYWFSSSGNMALFSPVSWFILFYMLCFWLPQTYMQAFNFTLIGANNVIEEGRLSVVIETQKVLTVFLLLFFIGYKGVSKKAPPKTYFIPFSSAELSSACVLGAIGLAAVLLLLMQADFSRPRSHLVASNVGKVLYTLSFFLTFGFVVLSAFFLKRKNYFVLLVLIICASGILLMLGGRGRSIWPVAGLIVWASLAGHMKIKYWKMLAVMVLLIVLLQALDPILLYFRGYDSYDDAVQRFKTGLELKVFLFARNFDAFHNLAVVVGEDRIQPRLSYMFGGSQSVFMSTYFRSVWLNGVGYPATLPGGLWLVGKMTAVILGGLVFGLFFGCLSKIYSRFISEFEIVAYVVAIPYLAHVGTSYLDSYEKMLALVMPGLVMAVGMRKRAKIRLAKIKALSSTS